MQVSLRTSIEIPGHLSKVFIVKDITILKDFQFTERELSYIAKKQETDSNNRLVFINRLDFILAVVMPDLSLAKSIGAEKGRRFGATIAKKLKEEDLNALTIVDLVNDETLTLALAEGLTLANYSFNKYKSSQKEEKEFEVLVVSPAVTGCKLVGLSRVCHAVFLARDLVNEPVGHLNAEQLSQVAQQQAKEHGFKAEVFNKAKIESLKMGGLLGVNKGSIDPPTFTILEWKPDNAINAQPYVFVGKGVVFDTGGINLKTPAGSLDTMKCDMSGAASVIGAFSAIAANNLPVYVVGLIPATDNRLGGNAIVPGDILKMYNGTTVEIINTDAEGRLILADALSFAKNYNPELVIDLATLTGSAAMAIGAHGMVGMGTADDSVMAELENAGNDVCERIVRFPFWDDYDDSIKSDIADIKNLGGREGGAISAGKFLAKFVNSPWIHLDIAGPAFLTTAADYKGVGGTGVGVRLLYRFMEVVANRGKI